VNFVQLPLIELICFTNSSRWVLDISKFTLLMPKWKSLNRTVFPLAYFRAIISTPARVRLNCYAPTVGTFVSPPTVATKNSPSSAAPGSNFNRLPESCTMMG